MNLNEAVRMIAEDKHYPVTIADIDRVEQWLDQIAEAIINEADKPSVDPISVLGNAAIISVARTALRNHRAVLEPVPDDVTGL